MGLRLKLTQGRDHPDFAYVLLTEGLPVWDGVPARSLFLAICLLECSEDTEGAH